MLDVLRRVARHRSGLAGAVLVLAVRRRRRSWRRGSLPTIPSGAICREPGRIRRGSTGSGRTSWAGTCSHGSSGAPASRCGSASSRWPSASWSACRSGWSPATSGGRSTSSRSAWSTCSSRFPGVLLAIMIVAIMGTGLENVMIAVGVVSIPTYTRLVRGQVLALKPLALPRGRPGARPEPAPDPRCSTCCRTRCRRSSCSRRSSSPRPSCGRPG